MSRWVDVGAIADLKFDPGAPVEVEGKSIALFRLDQEPDDEHDGEHDDDGQHGGFTAIDNVCPHASAPLCDGSVLDGKIVCYLHLWEFDLRTGRCDVGEQWNVQHYATRAVAGRLEIELPEQPS